jgi:hypothetical protein
MRYKTILKAYSLTSLTEQTNAKTGPIEITDWNDTVNKFAEEGWTIKNSGAHESSGNIIFWVLLAKEEQEEAINTGF